MRDYSPDNGIVERGGLNEPEDLENLKQEYETETTDTKTRVGI